MQHVRPFVVAGALALFALALLLAGPIVQPAHYHGFADARTWFGIPNTLDVLSNLPFLLIGLVGLARSTHAPKDLRSAWMVLCTVLCATCFGSAFYHWAPSDFGLLVDRIPIALACATIALLLLGDRVAPAAAQPMLLLIMSMLAVTACLFWYVTQTAGHGDLRPYLFMQVLPMLLVPLLTWLYRGGHVAGGTWWAVLALYALAKGCEVFDQQILQATTFISGHTLKHLLAAAAAWVLVRSFSRPV